MASSCFFLRWMPFSECQTSLCVVSLQDWENAASQPSTSQLNGFSPVWMRLCTVRAPDAANAAPHHTLSALAVGRCQSLVQS